MKFRVSEEIFTHVYLWRSSGVLIKQGEKDESYHLLLPSLLISFMAFEAFVNYLGYVLLPDLWIDEKNNFKGKGLEGKIEKITSKLPGFSWNKGQAPYQQLKKLESFRDMVAHGKVQASEYVTEGKEDGSHVRFEHAWDEYLKVQSIVEFRRNIKQFCQSLVVEARKYSDHLHLNSDAFEGSRAKGDGDGI